ncbi:MAG TPA: SRPBCC family protein [Dehalococcoidia bacterium]
MTKEDRAPSTQVYRLFIRAEATKIWDAITKPEFTKLYFEGTPEIIDGRYVAHGPGGEVWVDGAVIESDAPRRLVHEWRALYDADAGGEPASRVTWEIEPADGGICSLTVTHDRLEASPKTAASVGEGWPMVLSGLKTLVETGEPLVAVTPPTS